VEELIKYKYGSPLQIIDARDETPLELSI